MLCWRVLYKQLKSDKRDKWIPAFARMTTLNSYEWIPAFPKMTGLISSFLYIPNRVIPEQSGIQKKRLS